MRSIHAIDQRVVAVAAAAETVSRPANKIGAELEKRDYRIFFSGSKRVADSTRWDFVKHTLTSTQ